VNGRQRFAAETRGAFESLGTALTEFAAVAAFVFTLSYIDHITSGPCRHCKR
jgi:hypothetical protein